ncbi:diguanylate cyclase [Halobacillus litoralis]|uniref:diguanylate cyclase n=1 Tax=Halobacillus litoralis TaxID=45668 RepID=UPI001CFE2B53|nr:diguanylate cyclase [Halobacillus litoralis]
MEIFKDWIANISVMIAGFYIVGKLIKEPVTIYSKYREKYRMGYLGAAIGLLLMFFSIQVTDEVMIDLRHIPLILVAYFAGIGPAIVCAGILAFSRFFFGVSDSSILAFATTIIVGVSVGLVGKYFRGEGFRTNILLNIVSMAIISIHLGVVLPESVSNFEVVVYFWIVAIPAGLFALLFFKDIQKSKRLVLQLANDSQTDYLTGVGNVRFFYRRLNEYIRGAQKKEKAFALLLLDIDHFKKVNDTYGHDAGDQILMQLSELLQSSARYTDEVSRNGGEEFSILLPQCSAGTAREVAERIRKAVENYKFKLPDGRFIHLTISIGISHYGDGAFLPEELYKKADEALYYAKETGRNKVCI